MKKNLFFVAAAALAFAACSNEEILVDNPQVEGSDVAITFDTYAPNMTRAENSGNTSTTGLDDHHSNFYVWASKYAAGKYQNVWAANTPGTVTTTQQTAYYTQAEADTYNASLTGHITSGETFTAETAAAYNNATSTTEAAANATITDAQAKAYNATLSGAKHEGDIKTLAVWTASPLKFWDKTASKYNFFAAAPKFYIDGETAIGWNLVFKQEPVAANGSNPAVAADYSEATITLADFVLNGNNVRTAASTVPTKSFKSVADVDLMIASPCEILRTSYNKATPDDVNLQFNHILSRLNILVKKGDNIKNCEVSLTGLQVFNLKNKGSFNESLASTTSSPTLASGTIKRWEATGSPSAVQVGTAGNLKDYTPTAITLASTSSTTGVTQTAQYVLETLIIPQDITFETIDIDGSGTHNQAYIRIDYTIDGQDYYGFYNLAKCFNATATSGSNTVAFCEGWQNNLTITINPNAIQFTGEVFGWDTKQNVDHTIPEAQ